MPKSAQRLVFLAVAVLILGGALLVLLNEDERPLEVSPVEPTGTETAAVEAPPPRLTPTPSERPTQATATPAPTGGGDAEVVDPQGPRQPIVAAPTGLSGRVVDESDRAIPNAVVSGIWLRELEPRELARSDSDGRFRLEHLPPSGILEVSAPQLATRRVFASPETRSLVVVLLGDRELHLSVVAQENGLPLENARVVASSQSWKQSGSTDAMGKVTLRPPPEKVLATISAPERVTATWEEGGRPLVELARGRGVRGQILVQGSNAPAPKATVAVLGANQIVNPHLTVTDAQGRFSLAGGLGEDEEVLILAWTATHATPILLSEWLPPGEDEWVVHLHDRGGIQLTGAPRGAPILPVLHHAPYGTDPNPATQPVRPDGGDTLFLGLAPGPYSLEQEGKVVVDTIQVQPGQITTLEWREPDPPPPPGATFSVRVVVLDDSNAPVPGATVVATWSGEHAGDLSRQTDSGGVAELPSLPPGPWTFTASLPGRVLAAPEFRAEGDTQEVLLTLAKPVVLEGAISPAAVAEVLLLDGEGGEVRREESGPDGRFRLDELVPGTYMLEITATGYAPKRVQVTLPRGGPLSLTLEPGHEHDHGGDEGDGH